MKELLTTAPHKTHELRINSYNEGPKDPTGLNTSPFETGFIDLPAPREELKKIPEEILIFDSESITESAGEVVEKVSQERRLQAIYDMNA